MAKYGVEIPIINPMADAKAPPEDHFAWITWFEHNDPDEVLRRAAELHLQHFPYRLSTSTTVTKTEEAYFVKGSKRMVEESEIKRQEIVAERNRIVA